MLDFRILFFSRSTDSGNLQRNFLLYCHQTTIWTLHETVRNFHLENGSLLPYNAFMRLFCWDRKHFVAILIKFVLILYFKFLIWHKNINGNADTADMKGQWNNLQFFKFCVRFANNACVITWPHAFRIARKCLQSGLQRIFDVPGCRPCYARFII